MSSIIPPSAKSTKSDLAISASAASKKRGRPKGSKRAATVQSSALQALNTTKRISDTPKLKDLLSQLFSNQSTLSAMHKENSEESLVLQSLVLQALLKFQNSLTHPQRIHVNNEDISALKNLKTIFKATGTHFYKHSLANLFDCVIATTEQQVKPIKKQKLDSPSPPSPSSSTPSPPLSLALSPLMVHQTQVLTPQNLTTSPEDVEKAYNQLKNYLEIHDGSNIFLKVTTSHPLYPLRFFFSDAIHRELSNCLNPLLKMNSHYYLLKYFVDPESIRLASLTSNELLSEQEHQTLLSKFKEIKDKYDSSLNKTKQALASNNIIIPPYRHTWPHLDPKVPSECELIGINPMHGMNFATLNYIIYQTAKELLEAVKISHPNIYQEIINDELKRRDMFFINLAYTLLEKAEYYQDEYLCLKICENRSGVCVERWTLINHDSFDNAAGTPYNIRQVPNEPFYTKRAIDVLPEKTRARLSTALKTYDLKMFCGCSFLPFLLTWVARGIRDRYFKQFEGYLLLSQKNSNPNVPGPLRELLIGIDPTEIEKRHESIINLGP